MLLEMSNSVYTDAGFRISIDIYDAKDGAVSPYHSVTWKSGCQYNNQNMPDALADLLLRSKLLRKAAQELPS